MGGTEIVIYFVQGDKGGQGDSDSMAWHVFNLPSGWTDVMEV